MPFSRQNPYPQTFQKKISFTFISYFPCHFMIYSTRGIVLRCIKYGETSVIASIFTELFGIQSYMVNGVRTSGKTSKAHLFQPSSLLDMQVYHNELKNLQRIKEVKWSVVYKNVLSDVIKNSVALYMVELLQKCLKQPETNADLFHFCEDALLQLDISDAEITANFPMYFSLQLAQFFGFTLQDNYSEKRPVFSISEGSFVESSSTATDHLPVPTSALMSQLLKALHPNELDQIKLNRNARKEILQSIQSYYEWHIPDFGNMKTLPVLSAILND